MGIQGGFSSKTDSVSLEEKILSLKKEIEELENSKKNIKSEILSSLATARRELEDSFYSKEQSLVKEHADKMADLEIKKSDLEKNISISERKQGEIDAQLKRVDELVASLAAKENEQNTAIEEYNEAREKMQSGIAKYDAMFKELVEKSKAFDKKQEEAEEIIRNQQRVLSDKTRELEAEIAETQEVRKRANEEIDTAKSMQSSADQKLKEAHEVSRKLVQEGEAMQSLKDQFNAKLIEASTSNKKLGILIEENTKEKESLSKWRDELNEKATTVAEEQKLLTLRMRELDDKIKTLNTLRAKEGK